VLARRFADSGQPIFAIINGVTNSPNARPWELLYTLQNYGSTQSPIQQFRLAIDRVQAAPLPLPSLRIAHDPASPGNPLRLELDRATETDLVVESSGDLLIWKPHSNVPKGAASISLTPGTEPDAARFLRLARPGSP
jgi:hypothetical protein